MTWFKVSDDFAFHPKTVAAGPALTTWVRAGAWSAHQLTDGFVPDHMVPVLGSKKDAEKLVTAGLWERIEGGYRFHDWGDYQPTKADVEAERSAARERMREVRSRRKGTNGSGDVRPNVQANGNGTSPSVRQPRPDPTIEELRTPTVFAQPTAQTLLAEWIDHCDEPPPSRVKGHVARELGILLADGIPPEHVRSGLVSWHQKRLHPSALASVVHELRQGPPSPVSTSDQRVASALALAAKYAAEDGMDLGEALAANPRPARRAIGGGP